LNGLRAGKYAFRAASFLVEILILLIMVGPVAGAVSPEMGSQSHYGLGIDITAAEPQLNQIFSGSNMAGTHEISVPVFNDWPLPGYAGLVLALVVNNQTLYETPPASIHVAPFGSGDLNITLVLTPSLVSQLAGQRIAVGGSETIGESGLWTVTVSLAEG
jgi:hypothetical protein